MLPIVRDATQSGFRHKSILVDVKYADPQAGVHLSAGSADQDGSAASTSEARKRRHYARAGHKSFDRCSHFFLSPLRWEAMSALGGKVASESFS